MTPRRVLVAVVGVCLGLLGAGAISVFSAPDAESLGSARRVVVVGIPGLDWDQIDAETTPRLRELADSSALGSLTTRGASSFACPRDGWVTIGAGNRAMYGDADGWCGNQYLPTPALRPESVIKANEERNFGSEPGLLGREVTCARTYGLDAGLAVIDAPDQRHATSIPTTPEDWSTSWSGCPLALVAGPTIHVEQDSASELRRADLLVGQVAEAVASEPNTLLLVVGASDSPGYSPRMHMALAFHSRTDLSDSLLRSPSTGRTPYVQLIDVAPTVLDVLGQEQPAAMAGRPMVIGERDVPTEQALSELLEAADSAAAHRGDTSGIVWVWIIATGLFLIGGLVLVLLGTGRIPVRIGGAVVAAFPAATVLANLVPWWDADRTRLAWGLILAAITLAIAAVALTGPWGRYRWGPAVVIAVVGALALGFDVTTGSHLQLNGLLGYNPIVAGRFSGFGNMPFAIYAVSGLIAMAAALHSQPVHTARWLAVLIGATLVIVNGAPGLGADFGGVLALVPAILLLTMIATGIRLTAARIVGALAAGGAAVMVIAIADYQRAADNQTHLGRFVGQLLDGTAYEVIERKAEANWYLLLHSPVAILAPILVACLIGLFAWPGAPGRQLVTESGPAVRAAGVGTATAAVLGTLLNDSGIAVFVAAGCVTVPLLLGSTLPHQPASAEVGEPSRLSREPI
jgi:hypothetical protein